MAKYTTTTEELTSIADAIRTKTGDNSSLTYPTGFVNAIQNITTGNSNYDLVIKDTNRNTTSSSMITNNISLGVANITPNYNQQIITPETGLDGFHTVNVNAIPSFDPFGAECLYSSVIAEDTLTLDDTNFSNVTPSTSSQTILDSTNFPQFYRDLSQRSGCLIMESYVKYVYSNEANISARYPMWFGTYQFVSFGPRANSPFSYLTNEYNYASIIGGTYGNYQLVYMGDNGHHQITYSNLGIRVGISSVSFSNQSVPSNLGIVFRTPGITLMTHNSYAKTESFSYLDTVNTIIYYKMIYKEYSFGKNFFHYITDVIKNYYNTSGVTPV